MSCQAPHSRLFLVPLALVLCFPPAATAQPAAPSVLELAGQPAKGGGEEANECADGVVLDDGSAESGYGWVPSVIEGEYVQEFDADQFPSRRLRSVCVCWLRTRQDQTIDFEVVFYRRVEDPENEGRLIPAAAPYAVFPADAEVIPEGVAESFFEVGVADLPIPIGRSYIGVRWDARTDQFFFICADQSKETEPVNVFFRDDRADGEWESVFESPDPIFDDHRALMIRPLPGPVLPVDIPTLEPRGLIFLASALAMLALTLLKRRL